MTRGEGLGRAETETDRDCEGDTVPEVEFKALMELLLVRVGTLLLVPLPDREAV